MIVRPRPVGILALCFCGISVHVEGEIAPETLCHGRSLGRVSRTVMWIGRYRSQFGDVKVGAPRAFSLASGPMFSGRWSRDRERSKGNLVA